ncbi:putative bifunctional diguanylate cyclase/phosphodiesterase [Evansella sp. AB-rgal1]|uniref:putative bifunctional diguanylate cyclase/phosphodiesterase n=1 Tax=Evansella sp. AB-rgal1 TaxID=3242696 RepID=UPI00359EF4FF
MKIPMKLWFLFILCLIIPLTVDIVFNHGILESIWFISVIPIIPFSFYLHKYKFMLFSFSIVLFHFKSMLIMYWIDDGTYIMKDVEVFIFTTIIITFTHFFSLSWSNTFKETNERLNKLAFYDSLTDLPNQALLQEEVKRISNKPQTNIGIMFINIGNLKHIRATVGNSYGDVVLMDIVKRITFLLSDDAFIARYDGSEFVVVFKNVTKSALEEQARKLLDSKFDPFIINNLELFVDYSIGISICNNSSCNELEILKEANIAMYEVENSFKSGYLFFTKAMKDNYFERIELESYLRYAIEKKELCIYYQPKFDLKTKKIIGLEALLRWNHPKWGIISPTIFIPLAEKTGLIISIGKWVIRETFKTLEDWNNEGFHDLKVSINVSAVQIRDRSLLDFIEMRLKETNLDPSHIEFELTESTIHNINESKSFIIGLRSLGFAVSIDDFGVGYSNLNALSHLPISSLKIDKSFINKLPEMAGMKKIVSAIMNLGRELDLEIVAEGIETEDQLLFLEALGCEKGQGFLFSKPIPIDEVYTLLRSGEDGSPDNGYVEEQCLTEPK